MKKFLVVALVLAMACLSSVAFAAEVSVSGEVDIRSRLLENLDTNRSTSDSSSRTTTETRYMVTVNVKAENAKAKLTIWNEHDQWGTRTGITANDGASNKGSGPVGTSSVFIREAWLDVTIPGTPVGVKAGRMLAQIGNGWFFRSTYGGVDAWVAYANVGPVTIALQDAKLAEAANGAPTTNTNSDDVDIYSAIVTAKLGDMGTLGLDVSMVKDDAGLALTGGYGTASLDTVGQQARLYNIGLSANIKAGPATIKAEADYQDGYYRANGVSHLGYRGYQIVIQPTVKAGIVTINGLAAMGSGDKRNQAARTGYVNILDIGQHYTFLYEYRMRGASGATNTGFTNTTVLSVGALAQVLKNLGIGLDVYYLRATEQTNVRTATSNTELSHDLGWEIDGKLNWQITKDVSWKWQAALFLPGGAYNNGFKADNAYGFQGILGMKF